MFIKDLQQYSPKNEYSQFIKEYFSGIQKNGVKKYIKNIDVEIIFIEIDDLLIPLSFWNNKKSCYTSSILWMLEYLQEEIQNEACYRSGFWKLKWFFFKFCANIFYNFFKFLKVEENIFVFNTLLSTILYPRLSEETLEKIIAFLQNHFPQKSIIFRGINNEITKELKQNIEKRWIEKIAIRQIFYFEKNNIDLIKKKKSFIADQKIFEKNKFLRKENNFTISDFQWIKKCYDSLYIKKYTKCNPQFSIEFFKNWFQCKNTSLVGLLDENIKAVYGSYTINNQTTNPIFWYILCENKKYQLYRQISYISTINALKKSHYLNLSSGVGAFKMHRWAKKDIEYMMILTSHLSFFRKIPWKILHFFSKHIIEKELKNNIY